MLVCERVVRKTKFEMHQSVNRSSLKIFHSTSFGNLVQKLLSIHFHFRLKSVRCLLPSMQLVQLKLFLVSKMLSKYFCLRDRKAHLAIQVPSFIKNDSVTETLHLNPLSLPEMSLFITSSVFQCGQPCFIPSSERPTSLCLITDWQHC